MLQKFFGLFKGARLVTTPASVTSPLKVPVQSLNQESVDLKKYVGDVVLIVNTASQCGFTPQYKELQEIYTQYKDRGFVVLGFPSNDFGKQEPGQADEIAQFCEINYGVTFPLFAKGHVKGSAKQDVFKVLTEESDPTLHGEVMWNFEKFLINRQGHVVGRFRSWIKPNSKAVRTAIEKWL